jgi:hypothetical protein
MFASATETSIFSGFICAMTMKPESLEELDELEEELLLEPSALAIADAAPDPPVPLLPLLPDPPLPAVTAEPTAPEIEAIVPDIVA